MRCASSEKREIIRLVEQSSLPVKRTLAKLGISRPTFYRWYDRYYLYRLAVADLLNDRVLPFFEEHDVNLLRVLTDRGCEYCGKSRAARV
jgi:hypothetical protein